MATSMKSPLFLLSLWNRVHRLPGGKLLFRRALAHAVPYSDTVSPEVLELRSGYAKLQIKDRRGVRNHLGSIHAIALANVAELTSGLAFTCGLPADARGILKEFSIEYLKKGRGTLIAETQTSVPATNEKQEFTVMVETRDRSGALVTRGKALWLVGPLNKA